MRSHRRTLTASLATLGLALGAGSAAAVSQPTTGDADGLERAEAPLVQLPELPTLPDAASDAARSALESAHDRATAALLEARPGEEGRAGVNAPDLPELPDAAADQARDALAAAQELIDQAGGNPGGAADHTPDNPHIPENPGNPNK